MRHLASPPRLAAALLLGALSAGCPKDRAAAPAPTPPELSNATLYPGTAYLGQAGGAVQVHFSVDVADAGGDLGGLTTLLLDALGAERSRALHSVPAGAGAATLTGTITIPTAELGPQVVVFQASDTAGALSGTLHATFAVVEPPPSLAALAALSPAAVQAGSAGLSLTVSGSGFDDLCAAYWNGVPLLTSYVDPATLRADVSSALLAYPGVAQVRVHCAGGQLSNVLLFTVSAPLPGPAPVLSALSPASAEQGSGAVLLTLTGSGFEPGASIYWNGYWIPTVRVDAATLQGTVGPYELGSPREIPVTVRGANGSNSNALVFTVTPPSPRPVPVLSAISPTRVDAGSGELVVTVTGSGFHPASRVVGAGGTYPSIYPTTTFVSSTELRATVGAYDLSRPATHTLVVETPEPGGGRSAGQDLVVRIPPIDGVTAVDLRARDVAWDPYGQRLYLSVGSGAPTHPNELVVLDPFTGALEAWRDGGSEPGALALSDDGLLLYVAHGGASEVTRYTLPDLTLDLAIPLGRDAYGAQTATALAVAPGAPHTWAAALAVSYPSAIAVFDDATPRTGRGAGSGALAWGATDATLYALGPWGGDLSVLPVTGAGLGTPTTYTSAFGGGRIAYDPGTGLLYGSEGRAVDPSTGALDGTFTLGPTYYGAAAAPDSSVGAAYFATGFPTGWIRIGRFDLARYVPLDDTELAYYPAPATRMVRWGPDGLAILTESQVILVRGPIVLPPADTDNPVPVVGSLAPASVARGRANLALRVLGTGFVPGAVVRVGGADRSTRRVSATELTAYVPAAALAAAGSLPVLVVNPAPGGGASAPAALTVNP